MRWANPTENRAVIFRDTGNVFERFSALGLVTA
jgi:hypothetical protein